MKKLPEAVRVQWDEYLDSMIVEYAMAADRLDAEGLHAQAVYLRRISAAAMTIRKHEKDLRDASRSSPHPAPRPDDTE